MAIQPVVLVNGVQLNNGATLNLNFQQSQGLFEAAQQEPGAIVRTFDGRVRVEPALFDYAPRKVSITGRLVNQAGFLDKQQALEALSKIFSGSPARVQVGSLYLEVDFGQVDEVDDPFKRLGSHLTYRVEGEALPATFFSDYGYALGVLQGITAADDLPGDPRCCFSGNSFVVTNPGSAPTEAVVTIGGMSASITAYLKGEGDRRVPVNSDANGAARIQEDIGFILQSGANRIRLENADGTLYTATTPVISFWGTRWRFLGNQGNRMAEGPTLRVFRTGSGGYTGPAGAATARDSQARIGVPSGETYSDDLAGLVIDGDLIARFIPHNDLTHSHDLTQAAWVKTNATVTRSGLDNVVNFSATSGSVVQAITPYPVASVTRSLGMRLKQGTMVGSVNLVLRDQAGTILNTKTIASSDLSATEARSFYVTSTPGSSVTGLKVELSGNTATGTVIVESLWLVQGSFPGVPLWTGDTPIPLPSGLAVVDRAWWQNGAIEFDFIPPAVPSGESQGFFGRNPSRNGGAILSLWRPPGDSESHAIAFDRWTEKTRERLTSTALFFDGKRHRVRLEWANYSIGGVKMLPLRIYVDGVLQSQIDAASRASRWFVRDLIWVADGYTKGTLANLSIGYPGIPSGAIVGQWDAADFIDEMQIVVSQFDTIGIQESKLARVDPSYPVEMVGVHELILARTDPSYPVETAGLSESVILTISTEGVGDNLFGTMRFGHTVF